MEEVQKLHCSSDSLKYLPWAHLCAVAKCYMAPHCDFSNWKGSLEVSNLTSQLAFRHSLFQQGNSIHLFPLEI